MQGLLPSRESKRPSRLLQQPPFFQMQQELSLPVPKTLQEL